MSWTASITADLPVATVTTRDGTRNLSLDLYVPDAPAEGAVADGIPLLVYIHGGGWKQGSNDRPPAFRSILARGVAIASLQYRFSNEGSGIEMLADLRRGVQVARHEAGQRGVNVDRWFLFGISAGGHLVSLLAHRLNDAEVLAIAPASEDSAPIAPPTAVAPWCGVFNLDRYATLEGVTTEFTDTVTELEGGLTGEAQEARRSLSPVTYANGASRPHVFVHGEDDGLVPPAQSRLMNDALSAQGVVTKLILVPGREHAMPPEDSPEIQSTLDFLLAQPAPDSH